MSRNAVEQWLSSHGAVTVRLKSHEWHLRRPLAYRDWDANTGPTQKIQGGLYKKIFLSEPRLCNISVNTFLRIVNISRSFEMVFSNFQSNINNYYKL